MNDKITPIVSHVTPYGVFEVFTSNPQKNVGGWIEVSQVHSGDMAHFFPQITNLEISNIKADGIFLTKKEFINKSIPNILIKTADCLPIFLGSPHSVAMVHAGWRGLHKKILSHPLILKMKADSCFIGPHICQKCYEVGAEFQNHFPQSPGMEKRGEKWYFGQKEEATAQIKNIFPDINVQESNLCTFCDSRLHSYRRGHQNQRNYNIFKSHQF